MARIELRFDHVDNHGYAYYKPVEDDSHKDRKRGPSVLVNQTLVRECFRGIEPERARLTLDVENA